MSIKTCVETVNTFLFTDPLPEYGYRFNLGEGIGSEMMIGARMAKAIWKDAENEKSPFSRALKKIEAVALGVISAPLTILGATIRLVSKSLPHPFVEKTDAVYRRTDPNKIDQIYEIFSIFDQLAQKYKLPYWISAGTLLGEERHGGIIPWDDDGDSCMDRKYIPLLESMKEELASDGIILEPGPLGVYKLSFSEKVRKERFNGAQGAHVDIVPVIQGAEGRIISADATYRAMFPKEYFLPAEVVELERKPFGPRKRNLTLLTPKNPNRYLTDTYGKDCLKFGLKTHDHEAFFGMKIFGLHGWNPQFTKEKVKIVDVDCAQGHMWKGTSRVTA